MNIAHIADVLGQDVVGELERAVTVGFVKSRQEGREGIEAFERLLVSLLAAVIAPPEDMSKAEQRASACAHSLQDIVSQIVLQNADPQVPTWH